MQLAHRDYYQTSILNQTRTHQHAVDWGHDQTQRLPIEQIKQTLNQRVTCLDTLLEAYRLITPLLNALQGVVFFVKDADARYVLANLTLAQRCGYNAVAPILGHTCQEVFPKYLGSAYTQQDQQTLESGAALTDHLEMHLFHCLEPGWCLTHKLPIQDRNGHIIGLAGISHDLVDGDTKHAAYKKVAAVDAYISENFEQNIALAKLSEISGLSAAQLERYCKRVYQLTPRQIIHKKRIEFARKRLLEENASITDIGLSCGYSDHSAFSRQFKAVTGVTPQQLRNLST